MNKTKGLLFIVLWGIAAAALGDPATTTVTPVPTVSTPSTMGAANPGENYAGIGFGLDLPIQNVGTSHHGVLALVSGHPIAPNFVGEGEFDGMAYNAGSGGLLDMRLFATVKMMPDTPFIQPYGLLGFGFAGLLGVNADTPNLLSLDFVWGGGFRVELVRRVHLFLDYKMHILVRDYPTAIDSPLTGGITFPL